MSTENEGTAVPPAPSAPPVPVDSPAASPQPPAHHPDVRPPSAPASPAPQDGQASTADAGAPHPPHPSSAAAHDPAAPQGPGVTHSAPDASWPPPPPPGTPSYGDGGHGGGQYGDGQYGGGQYGGSGGQYGGGGWGASYQPPAPKAGRGRGGLVAALLIAALVAGGLGGGLGYTLAKNNDESGSTTVSASDTGGSVKRDAGTVAGVAAGALPSTVTIQAEGSNGEGGTGTGFVFDKQGHIVTNNHVVAEAVDGGKLSATFPDGKKYEAKVVGHAQGYDVAVIKLESAPSDLKPLPLGNSDKVAVGDSTIAIGAPFGLSNTVTTGIISAKNRPVASSDGSGSSKASYMSALQTDASINPGNSGGPLLDAQGNVIGINSAIQSTSNGGFGTGQAGSIGLGFAIPINQAEFVAKQLIKTGKPVYAKIGASVSLEETANGAKLTEQGVNGSEPVEPGGPAADAGLKPGDVITKLDDRVIDSGPTLIGEIWTHKPGDEVTVTYERGGKERTTQLTLGSKVGDD
ncbi:MULTISPECIES: S1C family serine protease [Streptomyces]|uniref:S1C family serine protease n=1 Tax=Streptomyces TaxID=1883 RepID=UPI001876456C|nr:MULTISPECIES: trypsin-like peptidase domain-containing protein [Streptomyces]MBQ0876977.1 trypsin-like peptidase domain-containing protein [Streptomyces sp. RT42]GHB98746.1 protease [Streptomyces vinaceusdrappus]